MDRLDGTTSLVLKVAQKKNESFHGICWVVLRQNGHRRIYKFISRDISHFVIDNGNFVTPNQLIRGTATIVL